MSTISSKDAKFLDAVRKGDAGKVETLFNQGANIDCFTPEGATALHIAIEKDHEEVFR